VWWEGVAVSENLDEYKYLGLYEFSRPLEGKPLRVRMYLGPEGYLYYRFSGDRESILIKWAKGCHVLDGGALKLVEPPEQEEELWV
jgi:hypothetical protein